MPSARQQLNQTEIDAVLGQYDLGTIKSINELAEGSAYSPKVIIDCDRGKLLLKRRAAGLDLPGMVAFSHEIMIESASRGICIPPLLGTKDTQNSMVQYRDHVYELSAYIDGIKFANSPELTNVHAHQAGALLAELYHAFDSLKSTFEPVREGPAIDLARIDLLHAPMLGLPAEQIQELTRMLKFGDELHKANIPRPGLVHGDWHPGNMIFRDQELVAICDFDNTRIGSRLRELAQGMIHASLKAHDPSKPAHEIDPEPNLNAMGSFWDGFSNESTKLRSDRNAPYLRIELVIGMIPSVMIDAALAMITIGNSDTELQFARSILIAITRKASWIDTNQSRVLSMIKSP